jgi:SAM-dependent methyltransferase
MVTCQTSCDARNQDEVVERVYRRTNLVATYANAKLFPPEVTAFIRYRDDLVNRRVLDMGCGAGRLAIYLRPLVAHYSGFDISPYMVDHCRREFAGGEFVEGDMRDLSAYGDASFDTILAVSNLFDAVSHADRLNLMKEVRRVLAPAGLLLFSAHNRKFAGAGTGPRLTWHRNPVTQLRQFADYWQASSHHRRLKPRQRMETDYALLNDSGNNYDSLHYYVNRDVQLRQLVVAGFQPLECLDPSGRTLTDTADDSDFPSIHYVARRDAGPG